MALNLKTESAKAAPMPFDPREIALLYYFGDLGYWKLPKIAADALELGFDGPCLRRLAGLIKPIESDLRPAEIDSAFRELGVGAPISRDAARLSLAARSAAKALSGESNVFDEAAHISIHLCSWTEAPVELRPIVALWAQSKLAPKSKWKQIEAELVDAMRELLHDRDDLLSKTQLPPSIQK
jgi:hypothetical protein